MRPHAALRPLTRPLPCHQHAHRALAVRAFAQQAKRNKKQPQPATSQTPEPEEDPRRRWLLTAQRISNFAVIPSAILYCIFFADYGEGEHVFSPMRRWLDSQRDAFFSLSPEERQLAHEDKAGSPGQTQDNS